jgi:hypothetical protein
MFVHNVPIQKPFKDQHQQNDAMNLVNKNKNLLLKKDIYLQLWLRLNKGDNNLSRSSKSLFKA